jgi:hypothetical protein
MIMGRSPLIMHLSVSFRHGHTWQTCPTYYSGWGGALKKMISPTKILPKTLAWVCDLYAGSTNLLFRHCSVLFALCNGRWSKPSAESCPFVGLTASPVLFAECTERSRRPGGFCMVAWVFAWLAALSKLGFAVASLETVVSRRRAV